MQQRQEEVIIGSAKFFLRLGNNVSYTFGLSLHSLSSTTKVASPRVSASNRCAKNYVVRNKESLALQGCVVTWKYCNFNKTFWWGHFLSNGESRVFKESRYLDYCMKWHITTKIICFTIKVFFFRKSIIRSSEKQCAKTNRCLQLFKKELKRFIMIK